MLVFKFFILIMMCVTDFQSLLTPGSTCFRLKKQESSKDVQFWDSLVNPIPTDAEIKPMNKVITQNKRKSSSSGPESSSKSWSLWKTILVGVVPLAISIAGYFARAYHTDFLLPALAKIQTMEEQLKHLTRSDTVDKADDSIKAIKNICGGLREDLKSKRLSPNLTMATACVEALQDTKDYKAEGKFHRMGDQDPTRIVVSEQIQNPDSNSENTAVESVTMGVKEGERPAKKPKVKRVPKSIDPPTYRIPAQSPTSQPDFVK